MIPPLNIECAILSLRISVPDESIDILKGNDANWFTVFMKAFVEKFHEEPPTKEQWAFIIQILEQIPTKGLSK